MVRIEKIEVMFDPKCEHNKDDKVEVKHVDFLFLDNTVECQAASKFYIMLLLAPKIVVMKLECGILMICCKTSK